MTGGLDKGANRPFDGDKSSAGREREQLVTWLRERGFGADQIAASPTPAFLPAARKLGDDGRLVSTAEAAESAGMSVEVLQRLQDAIGLPQIADPADVVILRADVEAAVRAKFFLDLGIDVDKVAALIRAVMASLSPVAAMLREAMLQVVLRPGATELEIAAASEELAEFSVPQLAPMLDDLLRVELRRLFEISAVTEVERAAGELPGARDVTVAFADLTGFTRLGEVAHPEELHHLAYRLADLARQVATAPVRFVKSIGDAVMLVCPKPIPLLAAALDLADAAVEAGLPNLRIGIAHGRAISRAGDWFGSPVNVASRVTAVATPGSVTVAESVWSAADGSTKFAWSRLDAQRLKGIRDDVVIYSVSRKST